MPLSLLIVDDHAGFRSRAKRALELDGFHVAGEAEDIASGVLACADLQPDVVLLDIHLPDGSGIQEAPRFADAAASARVVLISTYDEVDMDLASRQAGVVGFMAKSELSGRELQALLDTHAQRPASQN